MFQRDTTNKGENTCSMCMKIKKNNPEKSKKIKNTEV